MTLQSNSRNDPPPKQQLPFLPFYLCRSICTVPSRDTVKEVKTGLLVPELRKSLEKEILRINFFNFLRGISEAEVNVFWDEKILDKKLEDF